MISSYYEDEPFFESDHFWGVGEWVIFNKQFASVPVFEIVSDEIFNENLNTYSVRASSPNEIRKKIDDGSIVITPFDYSQLNPNSL